MTQIKKTQVNIPLLDGKIIPRGFTLSFKVLDKEIIEEFNVSQPEQHRTFEFKGVNYIAHANFYNNQEVFIDVS